MSKVESILKKLLIKNGTKYIIDRHNSEPVMPDEISSEIQKTIDKDHIDVEQLIKELSDSASKSIINNMSQAPAIAQGELFPDATAFNHTGIKIDGGIILQRDALPQHFLKKLENVNDNLAKQQKSAIRLMEQTNALMTAFNKDSSLVTGEDAYNAVMKNKQQKQHK